MCSKSHSWSPAQAELDPGLLYSLSVTDANSQCVYVRLIEREKTLASCNKWLSLIYGVARIYIAYILYPINLSVHVVKAPNSCACWEMLQSLLVSSFFFTKAEADVFIFLPTLTVVYSEGGVKWRWGRSSKSPIVWLSGACIECDDYQLFKFRDSTSQSWDLDMMQNIPKSNLLCTKKITKYQGIN